MRAIDFRDPEIIGVLSDALMAAGVDELEIKGPGIHLRLVVASGSGQGSPSASARTAPVATGAAPSAVFIVKAPMAGYFCPSSSIASSPGARHPCGVGQADIVGFVRVGPVLLPIPAGRSGRLSKQLAVTDALVGFGEPLFEMELQP
jgi:biotin carboxyl carrier protein